MSAGLDLVPGVRVGTSFRGTSAADWAAEKRASRMALCRWIRSLSVIVGLKQYLRHSRISWSNRQRPRAGDGMSGADSTRVLKQASSIIIRQERVFC